MYDYEDKALEAFSKIDVLEALKEIIKKREIVLDPKGGGWWCKVYLATPVDEKLGTICPSGFPEYICYRILLDIFIKGSSCVPTLELMVEEYTNSEYKEYKITESFKTISLSIEKKVNNGKQLTVLKIV